MNQSSQHSCKDVSVVTSVYKSEKFLKEFIKLVKQAVQEAGLINFEMIFVLDGITDNSKQLLLAEQSNGEPIKIVELTRNFGHHYALVAGMQASNAEKVFLTDCDLEVSPTILKTFNDCLIQSKSDVVFGYQETRKGGYIESFCGGLFWKLFNFLSETNIPQNVLTERLMTRAYVAALVQLPERNIFLGGMMYWLGFHQTGMPVKKQVREGRSSYSLRKRISLMVNAITSFSAYPLKILLYLGVGLTIASLLFITYLVAIKLASPDSVVTGFTALMVTILLSTGVLTFSIGVLGVYLEKIFNQVKGRPIYLIKQVYDYER